MKALAITLLIPAMFLIGCGKNMETNQGSAQGAITGLQNEGAISDSDAEALADGGFLDEDVSASDTGAGNQLLLKVGGADLLIDFVDQLTGAADEIAMVINGIEVPTSIVSDAGNFQGLIASLVTSQLEGLDVMGMPAMDLVEIGLNLINGNADQADFSNLFGTIVRGALNMFMGGSPIAAIVGAIAGPVIDNVLDEVFDNDGDTQNQNNNQNQNQNDTGSGVLDTIVGAIGGALGGGNSSSPLGGIFSLITNLFK